MAEGKIPLLGGDVSDEVARAGDTVRRPLQGSFGRAELADLGVHGRGQSGWASLQMLRRYGASARAARARRSYDRVLDDTRQPGRATGRLATLPGQPASSGTRSNGT
jgi:hypothetical protein